MTFWLDYLYQLFVITSIDFPNWADPTLDDKFSLFKIDFKTFSEDDRKAIGSKYWSLSRYDRQRNYLVLHSKIMPVRRQRALDDRSCQRNRYTEYSLSHVVRKLRYERRPSQKCIERQIITWLL